jgi:hypothetical protein
MMISEVPRLRVLVAMFRVSFDTWYRKKDYDKTDLRWLPSSTGGNEMPVGPDREFLGKELRPRAAQLIENVSD